MANAKFDAKKQYAVKAEAVVVFVNTVNERYLYRGALIPEQVPADEVKRLFELDLIDDPANVPVGLPASDASVDEE